MQYFISFLEGIITFISPCLLPMLPIYVSYFAGGSTTGSKDYTVSAENASPPAATSSPAAPAPPAVSYDSKRRTLMNALNFVLGFTLVFIAMGALVEHLGWDWGFALLLAACGLSILLIGCTYRAEKALFEER